METIRAVAVTVDGQYDIEWLRWPNADNTPERPSYRSEIRLWLAGESTGELVPCAAACPCLLRWCYAARTWDAPRFEVLAPILAAIQAARLAAPKRREEGS